MNAEDFSANQRVLIRDTLLGLINLRSDLDRLQKEYPKKFEGMCGPIRTTWGVWDIDGILDYYEVNIGLLREELMEKHNGKVG